MKAASLHDAKPEAWKEEKRPDPAPERLRYDTAVLARDGIGKLVREWIGPRSGAAYEALLGEWREATTRADRAYDAMIAAAVPGETA